MTFLVVLGVTEVEVPPTANLGSSGDLVATPVGSQIGLASGGELTAVGERVITPELRLSLAETVLSQAPATLVATLVDGFPDMAVEFLIDGSLAATAYTNVDGDIYGATVPVPGATQAGTHTLAATQSGAITASTTFTIEQEPTAAPEEDAPDPAPVPPEPGPLVQRWVLQDMIQGGLGTYTLPVNPSAMTSPHSERSLSAVHTTSPTGRFHVYEGGPTPWEWQFSGYCPTEEMHDKLVAFGELNRRFYLIDHRNRAWLVTFLGVDMKARLRQTTSWANGGVTDWGHDYTVSALVYEQIGVLA